MENFNLVDNPWIPVRYPDGRQTLVSLKEAFRESREIHDLACAPHERVSLMRLLVCITQRVFPPPETDEEWDDYAVDLETKAVEYLSDPKIKESFNLYGQGRRFLQTKVPASKGPVNISKLVPFLATGNNTTLNDQSGDDKTPRSLAPHSVALALLSFQNFYPLYGAGYKGKGPCVDGNMLHTLLLGTHLLETIRLNCITKELIEDSKMFTEGIGKPIWEIEEKPDFAKLATQSYLGRLVPRHRNLMLSDDRKGYYIESKSIEYPTYDQAREASSTIVVVQKGKEEIRRTLSARMGRSIWRDLHLILMLKLTDEMNSAGTPWILLSHPSEFQSVNQLWTGTLITDLKAKILDTVESTFTLPADMMEPANVEIYRRGVEYAENVSKSLYSSLKKYGEALKQEKPPVEKAQSLFWHQLDQRNTILINLSAAPMTLTDDFGIGNDPWTQTVRQAAVTAYEETCPRQTPRQYKAYAEGLRYLKLKPKPIKGKK